MRYFVILVLVCIVATLFSALFFMFKDKGDSKRMVKALTIRVALSVTLFLLLMAGFYFGLIGKDGL
jgi:Na+-driven multidrug efflux pump